jgi:hypothetical protein
LKKRDAELQQCTQQGGSVTSAVNSAQNIIQGANGNHQGIFSNTITNIVVIVGFAIFAYIVNDVIKNLVD